MTKTTDELLVIAEEIIVNSDGSHNIDWGEDFAALEFEDRERVEYMVWEQIAGCDDCGWHFTIDNMEYYPDVGTLCWKCESDREEEEQDAD
jgi:hypothetical protein